MAKRGLLIGSATGSLTGVAHDIKTVRQWLERQGFALDIREGVAATRESIMDGLRRLSRDTTRGDAAVVYYSGHGGYSQIAAGERHVRGRIAPRAVQYLVPTDHDKRSNFRGIFRAELSLAVRDLAESSRNITVILDCCHSTDMVRPEDAVLKGVIEPWGDGVEAHIAWLQAQGHDLERLPELRHPAMVLLSACEAARQAFEIRTPDNVSYGLFTRVLVGAAAHAPTMGRVTWDDVMRRVTQRVLRHRAYQRPQVSGPSSRVLFTEQQEKRVGALTLQRRPDHWRLSGGEAAGVRPGDRYRLVDPLATATRADSIHLEVSEVDASTATVVVEPEARTKLEAGMVAVPHPGGPAHVSYRVDGSGPLADELQRRVARVPGLGVVGGQDADCELAFVVVVDGDEVQVRAANAAELRWRWRDDPTLPPAQRDARLGAFVDDLRALARGTELLGIARTLGAATPSRRLSHVLEWGVVEAGRPRSLPEQGAELTVGDRVFVAVENTSSWAIRVSIFDLGVGRAVTLLNPNEPEGIDLAAGEREIIGAPELGQLRGLELQWPEDTPADGPREESLILFISAGAMPLTGWETAPWREHAVTRHMDVDPRATTDPTYLIRHITFRLHPRDDTAR